MLQKEEARREPGFFVSAKAKSDYGLNAIVWRVVTGEAIGW